MARALPLTYLHDDQFFYLAHFIVQGKVFSATSVISWQLLLFSLRVSQSPRTRHKCFDALLRVASSALSFSGAARPGSSHRAPGRGRADLAARGRGAAAGTMAARVSPWVEGTRVLETLGEGSFGSVVLARAPVADGSGGTACTSDAAPIQAFGDEGRHPLGGRLPAQSGASARRRARRRPRIECGRPVVLYASKHARLAKSPLTFMMPSLLLKTSILTHSPPPP